MVQEVKAIVYGRVSSDRQEHEETIHSQLKELRVRVDGDGLNDWLELIDEGYSRDNLARPDLDTARDLISDGEYNCVHATLSSSKGERSLECRGIRSCFDK